MVVSVEISGVLEKKLRRLVELGVYASIAEAVRDAVRLLLEELDLRGLALELYLERGASLGYAAEFAGETLESMIDYMLSRGVTPVLGAIVEDDYRTLKGAAILDPSALFVVLKTGLGGLLESLAGRGFLFYAPQELSSLMQVFLAERIRMGMEPVNGLTLVRTPRVDEDKDHLLTAHELSTVEYAYLNGVELISDDARVRDYARRRGVAARSSLSLITTYIALEGAPPGDLDEIIVSLKAIPVLVPMSAEERWRGG